MKLLRKKKCRHCGSLYRPDSRNHKKQRYCSRPECRKVSKAESQRKWGQKNPDYFRSPQNVFRVQQWRKNHPDYSKTRQDKSTLQENSHALQDLLIEKDEEKQGVEARLVSPALQDLLLAQPAVLIGLIAHLTGHALQEDIASSVSCMLKLGKDILNSSSFNQGGSYDPKTTHLPEESPPGSKTIQLGRSPFGS
ncbi:hypothetical protein KAI46_10085 [bacterium]|nr:hypothetical protein [bacterium]